MSLFTTLAQSVDLMRGLELLVVGMAVVFAALVLVGVALVLIGRLSDKPAPGPGREAPPAPSAAEPPPATAAPGQASEPEIDAHLIVVLSAAAAAACGSAVRVRRVRFLHAGRRGSWAGQGRVDIHTSHNLQTRKRSR